MPALPTSHLLPYMDSKNVGMFNQASVLVLMKDLGYPHDTIELIGNIYTNSTTSFHGSHFSLWTYESLQHSYNALRSMLHIWDF